VEWEVDTAAAFSVVAMSYSRNTLAETELNSFFGGVRNLVIWGRANLLHNFMSFRPKTKAEKVKTFRITSI
jgi:hypothetical protein